MRHSQVIDNIKEVAKKVLPKGSALYLYGSRARGDYHEGSDWDLLLDKPSASSTRYARIGKSWKNSYPILAKRIPSLVSVTFTFHFWFFTFNFERLSTVNSISCFTLFRKKFPKCLVDNKKSGYFATERVPCVLLCGVSMP